MQPSTGNITFHESVWLFVKQRLEEKLKNQRDRLENSDTTFKETADARGQIKVLKSLLNLPHELSAAQGKLTK